MQIETLTDLGASVGGTVGLLYGREASEAVYAVYVHGTGAANSLAAAPAKSEGRVLQQQQKGTSKQTARCSHASNLQRLGGEQLHMRCTSRRLKAPMQLWIPSNNIQGRPHTSWRESSKQSSAQT